MRNYISDSLDTAEIYVKVINFLPPLRDGECNHGASLTLPFLPLRFDTLSLDCNDHLFVYDGGHAAGQPKVAQASSPRLELTAIFSLFPLITFQIDISCRNTKQSVGVLFTNTNHITLKYVTDGWGTDSNGFKLVVRLSSLIIQCDKVTNRCFQITAIKDPKHACRDFRCQSNGYCISPELLCDGINHCGDNSDESANAKCQSEYEWMITLILWINQLFMSG